MNPEELLAQSNFLTALARRLVTDEHAAQDVVQETWLAALRVEPDGVHDVRAWLAGVARNVARFGIRGDRRRRERELRLAEEGDLEGVPSTEEIAAEEELRRKVVDAVLALKEPFRSAIVLRYYRDLSHEEAARRLGVPLETLRSRLKKGVRLLRRRLDGVFGDRKTWILLLAPLAGLKFAPEAAAATAATATSTAAGTATGSTTASAVATSSATTVTAGSSLLTGALIMSAKLKLGIAATLVAASLFVVWKVMDPHTGVTPPPEDPVTDSAPVEAPENKAGEASEASFVEAGIPERETVAPEGDALAMTEESEVLMIALTGRFQDRFGEPISDVSVRFPYAGPRGMSLASGTDGRFRFELDPSRQARRTNRGDFIIDLRASKKRYVGMETELGARPGETVHLGDVTLDPGGDVSGRVVDEAGNPVSGAMVGVGPADTEGESPERMRTFGDSKPKSLHSIGDTGEFSRTGVPVGWIRVWAEKDGYLNAFSEPLELRPAGEIRDVILVMKRKVREDGIGGIVLDPEGKPAPHASVKLRYRTLFGSGSRSTSTDEKGRFYVVPDRDAAYTVEARDRQKPLHPRQGRGRASRDHGPETASQVQPIPEPYGAHERGPEARVPRPLLAG